MNTYLYMVRHGDSPKKGNERIRELTPKGMSDARKITDLLKKENIDVVVSSPYLRSVLTVEGISRHIGRPVMIEEDLKERIFSSEINRISDRELRPILEKSFKNPDYAVQGGESNAECQSRAVAVLNNLLSTYEGKDIVIGTHGAIMTLMMGYFDSRYDLDFLHTTSKPDVYRMAFNGLEYVGVQRLWSEREGMMT
ncbi:histidine phosphatase family protein [Bacillus sp. NTK074B]|uniref:histidine phosphatase family protein n=1 Tax=Bacillus sp. NTK074B TaxID=2802174 RepID=UPI001A8DBD5A|nr:histidine phosphatase family protein [Bacillus sp. NTK074B]